MDLRGRLPLKKAAIILLTLLWCIYIALPLHLFQPFRWTLWGQSIPVYYFFTVIPIPALSLYALSAKQNWSKWKILWWIFPLACLPGIFINPDSAWGARQWFSLMARGIAAGGTLFLLSSEKQTAFKIVRGVYLVAVAAAFFGIFELYFNHNPIVDRYIGQNIPSTAKTDNLFYRPPSSHTGSTRPLGTQGNRIPYIAILLPFIPLGLWGMQYGKQWKWLQVAAVCPLILAAFWAPARSGWVGLASTLVIYSVLTFKENKRFLPNSFLLLLGIILLGWTIPSIRQRTLQSAASFNLQDRNILHRLGSYPTAQALKGHWLSGVGYGRYPQVYRPYYRGPIPDLPTPDNQYLRWLIETGLVGFAALALFLGGLIRAVWKKIKTLEDSETAGFYKALLAGWAGIATTFLFFDGFYWGACNMTFWCFLGLLATCLKPEQISHA